ncbi:hypothetical protein ABWH89_11885 [Hoeflea alexandrii]|uniref:hypothetical protein n=1 Tax=Hoeflea alexandrii TaxID=288436 RepID=UPI0035D05A58
MTREENVWFAITLGIGLLLGGVVALWYAEFSPDQSLIFDYQALIAGVLALIAGVLTVFQMTRVDIRQADRHRELMSIQLRKDALILDRYRFELSIGISKTVQKIETLKECAANIRSMEDFSEFRSAGLTFLTGKSPTDWQSYSEASELLSAEFQDILQELAERRRAAGKAFHPLIESSEVEMDTIDEGMSLAIAKSEDYLTSEKHLYEHVSTLRSKYVRATGLPLKDISFAMENVGKVG